MSGNLRSPAAPRACGTCSLCCKLIGIAALDKPIDQWCPHCAKSGGCSIYATRPDECRTFNCEWLVNPNVGDAWQPTRAKMVLHHVNDAGMDKVVVHVDPGSPQAWRKEPFYGELRRWARELLERNGTVNIYLGKRVIVVLPDRDVDLGAFNPGDKINFRKRRTATGWECEVSKAPAAAPPA